MMIEQRSLSLNEIEAMIDKASEVRAALGGYGYDIQIDFDPVTDCHTMRWWVVNTGIYNPFDPEKDDHMTILKSLAGHEGGAG